MFRWIVEWIGVIANEDTSGIEALKIDFSYSKKWYKWESVDNVGTNIAYEGAKRHNSTDDSHCIRINLNNWKPRFAEYCLIQENYFFLPKNPQY